MKYLYVLENTYHTETNWQCSMKLSTEETVSSFQKYCEQRYWHASHLGAEKSLS